MHICWASVVAVLWKFDAVGVNLYSKSVSASQTIFVLVESEGF
jgi:hypothetical protein